MMDSVILVHESVPDDVTFRITRTLIRNRGPRLIAIHASMGAWNPTAVRAISRRAPWRVVPCAPSAKPAPIRRPDQSDRAAHDKVGTPCARLMGG
jgi:hypothetical protein